MPAALRRRLLRCPWWLGLVAGTACVAPLDQAAGGLMSSQDGAAFASQRAHMVSSQIEARGVRDRRVLAALGKVPRHLFVPESLRDRAYDDYPLPIGDGQTISQPYIVAYMTEELGLSPEHRVLEIGTGSGYQAAVLAELARQVYSIEVLPGLAERAREVLASLDYTNVEVRIGDGYLGWPEHAPFDRIIVTAAPEELPQALVDQLADGGRMVVPVGGAAQSIRIINRRGAKVDERVTIPVRFVPMVRPPR